MSYSPLSFGPQFFGSARSLQTSYVNGTAFTITAAVPVSIQTNGTIALVNPTSDSSIAGLVGITVGSIAPSASGLVIDSGRLEKVSTTFSVGDALYINTDGTVINIRPAIGIGAFVAGDYVVFVGVVVQNQYNPSLKDYKLYLTVVGQL